MAARPVQRRSATVGIEIERLAPIGSRVVFKCHHDGVTWASLGARPHYPVFQTEVYNLSLAPASAAPGPVFIAYDHSVAKNPPVGDVPRNDPLVGPRTAGKVPQVTSEYHKSEAFRMFEEEFERQPRKRERCHEGFCVPSTEPQGSGILSSGKNV